jgi:hypothetical protein
MTLRQTLQAAPTKTGELIAKLSETSNQALKTRESLFAALSEELARYVEIEEQNLLPLLRTHPDTKELAADAAKGNKELRALLTKLAAAPKDDDAFLVQLAELDKSFQQHVRNERKELLPSVIKALSDEEARELAENMERAAAVAEEAKREEKRQEASRARRKAQAEEEAATAQRAAVRAEKAAERKTRESAEKVAGTVERGAAAVQEGARQVTANITQRAQKVASEAGEAMAVVGGSARKIADELQVMRASSTISAAVVSDFGSTWFDWFGKATRANVEASQQLLQCRTAKQLAELQGELITASMRNWMESSAKLLQITQRTSRQALAPLESRLEQAA